jgi:hypothetical protein
MLLPTAHCPRCRRDVLVYRTVADEADPMDAELQSRCVDCDTRLDRFGTEPELTAKSMKDLGKDGYRDLDKPPPIGRGGCFEERGCEGCPKIDSRPW